MMKTLLLAACVLGLAAAPSLQAQRKLTRADYVARIESCEAILQEFQDHLDTQIPQQVLREARAIVITNQFKAGFILGVKDGYGVFMLKKKDGQWSVPALIKAGEASVGLQVGGRAIETVYIFTDDQTPRLLFTQRFNVGVDAGAVAGPKTAEAERTNELLRKAPVLIYTKEKGLYAGATVKTGFLMRDDHGNRFFYNTEYSMPEIVDSDWITPPDEVKPLMALVTRITK